MHLEFLSDHETLTTNLEKTWVTENFIVHNKKLHKIRLNTPGNIGDPPSQPGTIILLEVLEYEDLVQCMTQIHEHLGHASVGTTTRNASLKYWHPDLILAVHEAVPTCTSCQLMSRPDPSLGDLRPIQPAPPLTRWGIDHTQVGHKILLNAVEYATGRLESRIVPNADFVNTVPLLLFIVNTFGAPRQLISDNA